jgi:hypothetical protein
LKLVAPSMPTMVQQSQWAKDVTKICEQLEDWMSTPVEPVDLGEPNSKVAKLAGAIARMLHLAMELDVEATTLLEKIAEVAGHDSELAALLGKLNKNKCTCFEETFLRN